MLLRHVQTSSRRVSFILVTLKKDMTFLGRFSKNSQIRIKFHENPSSRNRVGPCGRIGRRTDLTKLQLPSRSLAKAPKHSDMYVTSTFKVYVCMYRHMYTVVYLTHSKKQGSSQVTAHTINK